MQLCAVVSICALVGLLIWAQVPGSSTALPRPYPPVDIPVGLDETCPTMEQRSTKFDRLTADIMNEIEEHVVSPCGLGWMRAFFINVTDPNDTCPNNWQKLINQPFNGCGRTHSGDGSCSSVLVPINMEYSEVCGRIIGHQYAGNDGFAAFDAADANNIDDQYVDGVSITYGNPRTHIWTFAVALADTNDDDPRVLCPCDGGTSTPPSFVEDNWFCESGHGTVVYDIGTDPLWDGAGCAVGSTCCDSPVPWFKTTLSTSTMEDIEIRICGDETTSGENVYLESVEIYVK